VSWRVVVAGAGAIGTRVAAELEAGRVEGCRLAAVLDSKTDDATVEAALRGADLLVEASSNAAARELLPRAFDAGLRVLLCSCGVLADRALEQDLRRRGVVVGTHVLVPAGAIGGLDILGAASRAAASPDDVTVRHTTTKRPAALGLPQLLQEAVVVFRGSAREAALAYPLTSNSSVALALATTGLDHVEVVVVADPAATGTRHRIELAAPVGRYDFLIENTVSPGSGGRTSEITAWSVVSALASIARSGPAPADGARPVALGSPVVMPGHTSVIRTP